MQIIDTTFYDLTAQLVEKSKELTKALGSNTPQGDIQNIFSEITDIHQELCYLKQRRMAG